MDSNLKKYFEEDLLMLRDGVYESWEKDKDARLVSILLFDQFSRRIYKGQQDAYYFDHEAMNLAREYLTGKIKDRTDYLMLSNWERLIILLPFVHSEELDHVNLALKEVRAIDGDLRRLNREGLNAQVFINAFQTQAEVLEKFGQYPWRNQALGRFSSSEEKQFLETIESPVSSKQILD